MYKNIHNKNLSISLCRLIPQTQNLESQEFSIFEAIYFQFIPYEISQVPPVFFTGYNLIFYFSTDLAEREYRDPIKK